MRLSSLYFLGTEPKKNEARHHTLSYLWVIEEILYIWDDLKILSPECRLFNLEIKYIEYSFLSFDYRNIILPARQMLKFAYNRIQYQ
jgi:hypothetical protein